MIGEVVIGINNIYTVRLLPPDDGMRQCRIGGKVLQGDERVHNPIAVGDRVFVDADPLSREVGWITGRGERSGTLTRYNKKRRAPQVLAANVDLLICVSSARHPPFRPRFLDRLLVGGETGGVEPVIFVNKCDLGVGRSAGERIDDYRRMGYGVLNGSAVSGEGIDRLHDLLRGRTSVMIGQSGVGKSSVLNRLEPSLRLRVGDLSAKFDRGAHTTNFAVMVTLSGGARIIDTPGIRELDVHDVGPEELGRFFREFADPSGRCAFSTCCHVEEPDCAVRRAVEDGLIHPDRYESYLRLYSQLEESRSRRYG